MALKVLMIKKRLDDKKKLLRTLTDKSAEFETREAELEKSIEEAETDEEKSVVEAEIEKFNSEKEENEKEKAGIQKEIEDLEAELEKEIEDSQRSVQIPKKEERKEVNIMENRTKFFDMNMQERTAFFENDDVKCFISNVRSLIGKDKRAIGNASLTIPQVALPLIKQVAVETSKLMKYVTVRPVSGTSRQVIMGDIPEAFWDEMCAPINEMNLGFYASEMDGYKVSGYFAVCNAILEDNDVSLATELLTAIGKAIGKAIDKAILYGKGVKMPMGIVTSITKALAPNDYPSNARPWVDLSTSHVIAGTSANATGIKLFQEIVKNKGIIKNDYSADTLVWVMNDKTKTKLLAESIGINSAAAITAGMGATMPVVGGAIVDFDYIPDDTIIYGYFGAYTLAERAGTQLAVSEHVKFIDDQTVFRGTGRYDGKPTIREAFAVMGIGKAPDTTAPKFAGEV